MPSSFVIYSDIDGTLVDERYCYEKALSAINLVKKKKIPLVFCTSKTRAEIEAYRKKLGITDPFISENGGAVFIPRGYFKDVESGRVDGYRIIELGTPYRELRDALDKIRETIGCKITGFGDMTCEDVVSFSGLDPTSAELAKRREYDEPFRIEEGDEAEIIEFIKSHGLNYTRGGRFHHILGNNDKGKAVRILTELFRKNGFRGKTIALGDGENDIEMLEEADIPVLIKRPDGTYINFKDNAIKTKSIGPEGWSEEIVKLIS